jgi:hypothetical protein
LLLLLNYGAVGTVCQAPTAVMKKIAECPAGNANATLAPAPLI